MSGLGCYASLMISCCYVYIVVPPNHSASKLAVKVKLMSHLDAICSVNICLWNASLEKNLRRSIQAARIRVDSVMKLDEDPAVLLLFHNAPS